jgi:poly-gamma-glutamate synthesis protein (capsule biosynthesis protein)
LLACAKAPPSSQAPTQPPAEPTAAEVESTPTGTEPTVATDEQPPAPEPYRLPDEYLRFSGACTEGERVTIAAAGDLLIHHELAKQAFEAEDGFENIWANISDLLEGADLTYLNLEGPVAPGLDRNFNEVPDPGKVFDKVVYTGYPRFNYHPSVAKDLRRAGVDIVSTANNHALDRGPVGVDRTIGILRRAGLKYVGTRPSTKPDAAWHTTTKIGDLKVAWIACTRHTNQVPDSAHQVLRCDKDMREIEKLIRRLAARKSVDAVIVTPHQGKEYQAEPGEKEIDRVHRWLEAGALAVLGSHPHVLVPWEKYLTSDGRETFVIHSLGNFASHQPELPRRSSMLLYLGLVRGADGVTRISGVRYVPLHVRQEGERFFTEAIDRVGGPAESRDLTTGMFGAANVLPPGESLVLDPHCDAQWRAPSAP